jgi:hypothetical protein
MRAARVVCCPSLLRGPATLGDVSWRLILMANASTTIELMIAGLWLGSIVFFSFFVAPVLFRALAAPDAAKVVRAIFPRYYLLGIFCGLTLCSLLILRRDWARLTVVIFLTLIDLYCRQFLTPRINEARDAGAHRLDEFNRMHRLSVRLNGVVMLGLVAFFISTVYR